VLGSLACKAGIPKEVLKKVGEPPHLNRCPRPKGSIEVRGNGDSTYNDLRLEGTKARNAKYLSQPDRWTPEFRKAYAKAGNTWPVDANGNPWEIHHIKPLAFGGTNEIENFVALERAVHRDLTTWWGQVRDELARPFGGAQSPRWIKIVKGVINIEQ
jgi:hypothetical protein